MTEEKIVFSGKKIIMKPVQSGVAGGGAQGEGCRGGDIPKIGTS